MDANYNLTTLISRVKTRLHDEEYSDDTITQFLNDAYFEIVGDSEYTFLERHYRSSTQTGGILYLPPDFQSVKVLTAKTDTGLQPLKYMPDAEFFAMEKDSALKNYRYTIFANTLFYGLPDITEDKDKDGDEVFYDLDVYYLAKPRAMVNPDDKPLLPYEFSEALILSTLARAERLRDNFDYAAIYENKCDELLTNMKLRYCPRQLDNANRAQLPVVARLRH